jgi:hypothetical protein
MDERRTKMRSERAQAKKESREGLLGVFLSLVLVAGVLLSLKAPTQLATSFVEVGNPQAAELVTSTPDRISPGGAIAETASLDLQLD